MIETDEHAFFFLFFFVFFCFCFFVVAVAVAVFVLFFLGGGGISCFVLFSFFFLTALFLKYLQTWLLFYKSYANQYKTVFKVR